MSTFTTERLCVVPWREALGADPTVALAGLLTPINTVHLPPEWQGVGADVDTWLDDRDTEGAVFLGLTAGDRPAALLVTDLVDDVPEELRVGFVIAEVAAGRGLATELLDGLAAWAVGHGIERLVAGLDPANVASRRVLEKAGFSPDAAAPDGSVMVADLDGRLPRLHGGAVVLRSWRAGDAADLQRAMQDPEIVRWMAIDQPYALEHAEGFIAGVGRAWEERTAAHFVIEVDGRLAGYLGVLSVEDGMRVVELGYWVVAEARGRGTAREAVALAVEWARDVLAPERVELGMLAGNEASRRVAEANGFVFERTQASGKLLDGEPADEWVFVLG